MRGKRSSQTPVASRALLFGVGSFIVAAAGLAAVQGVDVFPSGACDVSTWAPLRALPWVVVAALPALVYALVLAQAARRRPAPLTLGDGPYRQGVLDEHLQVARPRSHVFVRGLLVVLALALGFAESRRWSCPYAVPASCRPRTSSIAILGVGKFEPSVIAGLVKHFHDCYGLPVVVARPIEAPATAWNPTRHQWTAEALLAAMPGCRDGDPQCDASVLVIGVTSDDIYTVGEDWRYAFTSRDSARHAAIISTAQMTSLGFGTSDARVRKFVAKTIALEYCGLPQSSNPSSVRYNAIMGPNVLDAIDESVW